MAESVRPRGGGVLRVCFALFVGDKPSVANVRDGNDG